jgi:1,2-diacylglycerol 3-beta-galactosyltransferase
VAAAARGINAQSGEMKGKPAVQNTGSGDSAAKRVLVLTADAGFGHRSAAKAIVAALKETRGELCHVEMVNPLNDERVPALLRESQTDYDKLVQEMPRLYEIGYEAADGVVVGAVMDGALVVMLFEVMRDLLREYRPDKVVTTYPLYQAPLSAVYLIDNHHIPLLSVVTDLVAVHRLWFHKNADLCMTPTEAVRDQAIDHGLDPQKVHVTGIPVHPDLARDRDRAVLRAELGWHADLAAVLAVGSKRVQHLEDTLRVLNHSGLPLQLIVVAGGDDALYRHSQDVEWHAESHLYNFVTNLPDLMHAADCIVCKAGGLIVAESLACGLPLLLIDVLPSQEAGNANYVVQNGAGELATSPLDAVEIVHHWLAQDKALLAERALKAQRLGRPRSAYEVADRVWAAAQRGPQRRDGHHSHKHRGLIELLERHRVSWRREPSVGSLSPSPRRHTETDKVDD